MIKYHLMLELAFIQLDLNGCQILSRFPCGNEKDLFCCMDSTISSGLNSLAAVFLQDLLRLVWISNMSEKNATLASKIICRYCGPDVDPLQPFKLLPKEKQPQNTVTGDVFIRIYLLWIRTRGTR